MRKILEFVLTLLFALVLLLGVAGVITPDKDKNGNYTQPIQYWTDSEYFNNNF